MKVNLDHDEKKVFAKNLREHFTEYSKNPDCSMMIIVERIIDDINGVLESKKIQHIPGKRLKPKDKGDKQNKGKKTGFINISVKDYT